MQMNKKGFTLIELLGVIVLLVLIAMIITPVISSGIKQGKEKADKQIEDNIILAARNWAADNKKTLEENANPIYTLKLQQLQDGGYIDKNIKLPSTGEVIPNVCVHIKDVTSSKAIKKQYEYSYDKDCDQTTATIQVIQYTCPNEYKLNDDNKCEKKWAEETTRNENKNYYCTDSAYTLNGNQCQRTVRETTNQLYSPGYYYCPSSYPNKSGTDCYTNWVKVDGVATCKDGVVVSHTNYGAAYYECDASRYVENGVCAATGTSTHYPYGYCRNKTTASYASGYYYCPTGYTNNGSNCYKDVTTTKDAAYTFVYSCPAGYTSTGSGSSMTCSKEVVDIKASTPTKVAGCPSGYKLITNNNNSYCQKEG